MIETPKPVEPIQPTVNDVNRPFWEGCGAGKLLVQRCAGCGYLRFPPGVICPRCLSAEAEWHPLSGNGTVFSFVVFHHAYHPAWKERVPYNVAMIELDEGPMMMSNVVGIDNDKVEVGLRVAMDFEPMPNGIGVPVFRAEALSD